MECKNVVIGAGVVGLAIARQLSMSSPTILFEKNRTFGLETSSRNSQVIHSGLYYPANTLKTKLCIKGRKMLYSYLIKHNLPFKKTGKYIVGDSEQVLELYNKAKALDIPCEYLTAQDLENENIHCTSGIVLKETGILDAFEYMKQLESDLGLNSDILYQTQVTNIKKSKSKFILQIKQNDIEMDFIADNVINSAGLHADIIANFVTRDKYRLFYCKGHYYKSKKKLSEKLIYPIPGVHSLGLHLTVGMDGSNRFGPDVMFQDNLDYSFQGDVTEAGRIASQFMDIAELEQDYTGIRPKLSNKGFNDFVIEQDTKGFVNLVGIESPGLTSSLAIAEYVDMMLNKNLNL